MNDPTKEQPSCEEPRKKAIYCENCGRFLMENGKEVYFPGDGLRGEYDTTCVKCCKDDTECRLEYVQRELKSIIENLNQQIL